MRQGLRAALLLASWLPALALAHDSWFRLVPPGGPGVQLDLAVGPHYPLSDFGIAAASVTRAVCAEGGGATKPLRPERETATHLVMRSAAEATGGLACWAELDPWQLEMNAELVAQYFDEIRPGDAVRARWDRQRARNIAWRESFRKFLRIEWPAPAGQSQVPAALRQPRGLAFEIVPVGTAPMQSGQPAAFQVLLDGRPLAGQWVQLVGEDGKQRRWLQADAQGQVRDTLGATGAWLLRATWLEAPAQDGQPWHSRFVTLVVHAR